MVRLSVPKTLPRNLSLQEELFNPNDHVYVYVSHRASLPIYLYYSEPWYKLVRRGTRGTKTPNARNDARGIGLRRLPCTT